jgi:threonine dehydratase
MTSILSELEAAAALVYEHMTPTAQIRWPLLSARAGCDVWVKHENHTPIGAFKVRGGLVYLDSLRRRRPPPAGVIAATRGNHGQSIAFAARVHGMSATVVVPHGNSVEKNAAMRGFGAELIEHGRDFQEALEFARELARERGLEMLESYHPLLVRGVASAGLELLRAAADLHTVYVPIGLGSGICGMIAARDALSRTTEIVGVVSEEAPTYALSFARGEPVPTATSNTFADGVAVRTPHPDALERIRASASRIVTVTEEEIADAVRHYYTDTHNLAEGAGAAALAALLRESGRMAGRKVGVVLSGGNIDRRLYHDILGGGVPRS